MSKNFRTLILLTLTTLLSGCVAVVAGAAVGAGTYAYVKGELTRTYGAPLNKTWDTTIRTLNDLEIKIIKKKKDALKGTIEARRADESSASIEVKWLSETVTEISIRIGTWGDRDASEAIHDKIAKNLGLDTQQK